MVIYEGIFFAEKEIELLKQLEQSPLDEYIDNMHCTFYFRPPSSKIYNEIVGNKIEVNITGYACDGNNSAFCIDIPREYEPYYGRYFENGQRIIPHITISIKNGAKPLNSQTLQFKPLKDSISINGTFGYYMSGKDRKGYVSFEKVN